MGDPFIGEIKIISWNYPPKNWAFCNGQTLQIQQNQALFSLLGTNYGGDGRTTFCLPDLRGRVPMYGVVESSLGQAGGAESVTLVASQNPPHIHSINADAARAATSNVANPTGASLGRGVAIPDPGGPTPLDIYSTGTAGGTLNAGAVGQTGGQPHNNMQPYTVLNMIIALAGIFPSQN